MTRCIGFLYNHSIDGRATIRNHEIKRVVYKELLWRVLSWSRGMDHDSRKAWDMIGICWIHDRCGSRDVWSQISAGYYRVLDGAPLSTGMSYKIGSSDKVNESSNARWL